VGKLGIIGSVVARRRAWVTTLGWHLPTRIRPPVGVRSRGGPGRTNVAGIPSLRDGTGGTHMSYRPTMVVATLALGALLFAVGCQPQPTEGWRSTLVSVNATGTDSAFGDSTDPVFSPDGSKLAFVSRASDLVAGDGQPPDFTDVYVKDLAAGTVTLVSGSATRVGGGNGDSTDPVFSPDGTKIAFVSSANDLGPQDTDRFGVDPHGERDVYVHDLTSGVTNLASVRSGGGGQWQLGIVRPGVPSHRQQPPRLHEQGK
jgi:hypothetical protein